MTSIRSGIHALRSHWRYWLKAVAVQWRRQWLSKACLLCADALVGQQAICEPCKQELPWLLHGCRYCALPIPDADTSCSACQQQRQPFRRVVACCIYEFPVSALIGRFKYSWRWSHGLVLSQILAEHLEYRYQEGLPEPDALLPVPLARKRQRRRGYNQAQMIADWLAKELQIPVLQRAALRVRYTEIQQGLSARQRQLNMRNAFVITQPAKIQGRHLALVDDVMTTGATCAALASSLLAAGAARVDVYCLARTGVGRNRDERPAMDSR